VHERDENGRLIKEKEATEEAICAQFEMQYEDLRPQDWHFMERGQETVLKKIMANEQCTWLHNIRIAQEIGANELDTTTTQL